MTTADAQRLQEARDFWNQEAATFDHEPDHGLLDPGVYDAWQRLLVAYLPSTPATILDIGCGTGSISVLLAKLGHAITGLDLSPAMITHAAEKAKSANQCITFMVGDAADPQFTNQPLTYQQFDLIICRHILWALPNPELVLQRWAELLTPEGRFVMIEGYWNNQGGMHAEQIVNALPMSMKNAKVQNLSDQPELWGTAVSDERYLVFAELVANVDD